MLLLLASSLLLLHEAVIHLPVARSKVLKVINLIPETYLPRRSFLSEGGHLPPYPLSKSSLTIGLRPR